jgi:hypothetical protein
MFRHVLVYAIYVHAQHIRARAMSHTHTATHTYTHTQPHTHTATYIYTHTHIHTHSHTHRLITVFLILPIAMLPKLTFIVYASIPSLMCSLFTGLMVAITGFYTVSSA